MEEIPGCNMRTELEGKKEREREKREKEREERERERKPKNLCIGFLSLSLSLSLLPIPEEDAFLLSLLHANPDFPSGQFLTGFSTKGFSLNSARVEQWDYL